MEQYPKSKVQKDIIVEGVRIGNKSSVKLFQVGVLKRSRSSVVEEVLLDSNANHRPSAAGLDANPFDVNLLDMKGKYVYSLGINLILLWKFFPSIINLS